MATDFSKFGVPMPGGIRNGQLQPKLGYRFRVIFKGFGEDKFTRELTQQVISCERPSINYKDVAIHGYNSVAYVVGKHEWKPFKMVVRDDITNAVQSAVGAQIQKQVNHYEQTSAVAASNVKFSMEIHYLDGTNGDELSAWEVDGAFLTDASFSEGKYDDSEAGSITLSFRYDNALLVRGPGGDGITVGADPFPNIPSGTGKTGASA